MDISGRKVCDSNKKESKTHIDDDCDRSWRHAACKRHECERCKFKRDKGVEWEWRWNSDFNRQNILWNSAAVEKLRIHKIFCIFKRRRNQRKNQGNCRLHSPAKITIKRNFWCFKQIWNIRWTVFKRLSVCWCGKIRRWEIWVLQNWQRLYTRNAQKPQTY